MKPAIITPASAYSLIQVGQYRQVLPFRLSENFWWSEVYTDTTPAELKAVPLAYYNNALLQAGIMEQVRAYFDDLEISVHCWYRSLAHNKRVGGAAYSQHLKALATDFHLSGHATTADNRSVQDELAKQPFMKDKGLEFTGGTWTHVDSRSHADALEYGTRFTL